MAGKKEESPIVFENLDGSSDDDDDIVDPLDLESDDSEKAAPDDQPQLKDPFAVVDEDDEPAPLRPENDPEEDAEEDRKAAAEQREEREQPDDLKAENERLRARLAAAERDGSLSARQLADAQKELYESRAKQIDGEIEQAKKDLKVAIEEGETDKQVELQARLADLSASKRDATRAMEQAKKAPQRPTSDDMPNVEAKTPVAAAWMKGRAWINSPAYAQQNRDLIRIAQAVAEDGYDPDRPDYYAELERRMGHRHPDLFPAKSNGAQRRSGKQAVAGVSRDDPPAPRSQRGKVVLDRADLATMRRYGLDPSKREHLQEFAKSKREVERSMQGARS